MANDVTGTCRIAAFLCRQKRRKSEVRNLGWIDGNVDLARVLQSACVFNKNEAETTPNV